MAAAPRLYAIRHHISKDHKFEIKNNNDEMLYIVHYTTSPPPGKLSFCDASTNKELMEIREESVRLHLTFNISKISEADGQVVDLATLKKIHGQHHSNNTFEIESVYGVYKVERVDGHFGHEFTLTTGGQIVVDVTKNCHLSMLTGTYHVEVYDDDGGDIFLLALVIALWRAQRWHITS